MSLPSSSSPTELNAAPSAGDCAAGRTCSSCSMTKGLRVVVAMLALGTAAAYGAITTNPQWAEYVPFLGGTGDGHACPMQGGACCSSPGALATPASPATDATTGAGDESDVFEPAQANTAEPVPAE